MTMTVGARIRFMLMAVLALGTTGTLVELLLLQHYEEGWQITPLALIALAMICLAWLAVRPGVPSVRAFQSVMVLFLVAGAVGVALHMQGAAEFQWEIDASQPRWDVFKKVMQSKAPPALAPGVMLQMGLIGLACVYRHPAVTGSDT